MSDLHIRQSRLIPQAMKDSTVLLAGLGMLGSWTAHALSRTVSKVHGWDMDQVGTENMGTQAYDQMQIGRNKADAMADQLIGLPFVPHAERWHAELDEETGVWNPSPSQLGIIGGRHEGHSILIVVSAVDSFETRRLLARWADKYAQLFIDTRAHATVGAVITVSPTISGMNTAEYLHELEQAQNMAPEPACGMEGTAFVGLWVAQQVANTVRRAVLGLHVPPKVVHDAGTDNRIEQDEEQEVTAQVQS